MSDEITRRDFVSDSSKFAMGAMIVPRRVLGGVGQQTPSDTLNVAIVGAGGMGGENAQELGSENIVAVCDIDHDLVASKVEERTKERDGTPREQGLRWQEQYADAAKYTDFREMLEQQRDIEAVVIATPPIMCTLRSRRRRCEPASTCMCRNHSPTRCTRLACFRDWRSRPVLLPRWATKGTRATTHASSTSG